jgi:hypothetical protein
MRDLVAAISNKKVLVIGSAPNPVIHPEILNDPNVVKVCIKGSGYSLYNIGHKPDILFQAEWNYDLYSPIYKNKTIDMSVFVYQDINKTILMQKWYQLNNIECNKFVYINDNHLGIFYNLQNNLKFEKIPQTKSLPQNLFTKIPISFGLGVVNVILNLNAKEIIVSGFNPELISARCHDSVIDYPHHEYHRISDRSLWYYTGVSNSPIYTSEPHLIELGIKPFIPENK